MSINTIIWDFDGVLMNSNEVRDKGFSAVLSHYPKEQVEALLEYHQSNGGLSRYVKFKYFFEEIRKEPISQKEINVWADKFSEIMLSNLINPELLIQETIKFIRKNKKNYCHHIASGSDQNELRKICKGTGISDLFLSIHGSPQPKNQIVADLISENGYNPSEVLLIGDSINDFEAANVNGIFFKAYNNAKLETYTNSDLKFS
ncbi:MAG: HAD family hydrolase [Salibacteraceae bacterium]